MIRFGRISETDPGNARARVEFQDTGVVSGWLPLIFPGTSGNLTQWTPEEGEMVAVIPGETIDSGVIIGAIYTGADPTSADLNSGTVSGAVFSDGSKAYLDTSTGELVVEASGKVTVTAAQEISATVGGSIFKATQQGLEVSAGGQSLKGILTDLVNALAAETHTTPVGPSGPPINIAQYLALIPKINLMLTA